MAQSVLAQDIIVLNNETADELEVKVVEVSDEVVKYRKWSYQDGPLFSIPTREIFVIKYQNGEKQRFTGTYYEPEMYSAGTSRRNESFVRQNATEQTVRQTANPRRNYSYIGQNAPDYATSSLSQRFSDFEPGLEGSITAGYLLGLGDYAPDAVNCLDLNIGWRFNPYFWLGGTAGNTFYYDYSDPMTGFVSILADVRGILPLGKKCAFYGEFCFGGAFGYGRCDSDYQLRVGPGVKIYKVSVAALYNRVGEEDAMLFQVGFSF